MFEFKTKQSAPITNDKTTHARTMARDTMVKNRFAHKKFQGVSAVPVAGPLKLFSEPELKFLSNKVSNKTQNAYKQFIINSRKQYLNTILTGNNALLIPRISRNSYTFKKLVSGVNKQSVINSLKQSRNVTRKSNQLPTPGAAWGTNPATSSIANTRRMFTVKNVQPAGPQQLSKLQKARNLANRLRREEATKTASSFNESMEAVTAMLKQQSKSKLPGAQTNTKPDNSLAELDALLAQLQAVSSGSKPNTSTPARLLIKNLGEESGESGA